MNCNISSLYHCEHCTLENKACSPSVVLFLQVEDVLAVNHMHPDIQERIEHIMQEQVAIGKGKEEANDDFQERLAASTLLDRNAVGQLMVLIDKIEKISHSVGIVIIESWSRAGTTEKVCRQLFANQPFGKYVIGRTRKVHYQDTTGEKIKEWITAHKVATYLIIAQKDMANHSSLREFSQNTVRVQGRAFGEVGEVEAALALL